MSFFKKPKRMDREDGGGSGDYATDLPALVERLVRIEKKVDQLLGQSRYKGGFSQSFNGPRPHYKGRDQRPFKPGYSGFRGHSSSGHPSSGRPQHRSHNPNANSGHPSSGRPQHRSHNPNADMQKKYQDQQVAPQQ